MQNFTENTTASLCWDDVRYFLELARRGTLSGAARSLGVEHTTVARRVAALEQRIGVRLFDRLPRNWRLTGEGEQLLQHARRIEDEALAFSRASLGVGTLHGTVRLSAPPAFVSHFVVPRLTTLRRRWPGITLELIAETREANLFRREADLALRLSRPVAAGLAARPLGDIGYGLYAAAAWLRRKPEHWEFVGYDDSLRETPQQQWLDKLAGARPYALRSNDLAALHQACRGGLGVAVLPHFLARGDKALHPLPDHDCPVTRRVWMVLHPDVRRSTRVKAVADSLVDLFRDSAAVLV